MLVKIYDPKLGIERTIQEKAFKILQKRYQFISYVDEEGNSLEGEPQLNGVQKKSQEKSVEPVEVKPRITVATQLKSPEEIAAKKAELQALNEKSIQEAAEKAEEQKEIKERKKPGPKPKVNAKV